jgi:hypothetical protein
MGAEPIGHIEVHQGQTSVIYVHQTMPDAQAAKTKT